MAISHFNPDAQMVSVSPTQLGIVMADVEDSCKAAVREQDLRIQTLRQQIETLHREKIQLEAGTKSASSRIQHKVGVFPDVIGQKIHMLEDSCSSLRTRIQGENLKLQQLAECRRQLVEKTVEKHQELVKSSDNAFNKTRDTFTQFIWACRRITKDGWVLFDVQFKFDISMVQLEGVENCLFEVKEWKEKYLSSKTAGEAYKAKYSQYVQELQSTLGKKAEQVPAAL